MVLINLKLNQVESVPPLRFDILEEVEKRIPGFPIVLHGSSSVPQEYVDMCNKYGGKLENAVGVPEDNFVKLLKSSCIVKLILIQMALLV